LRAGHSGVRQVALPARAARCRESAMASGEETSEDSARVIAEDVSTVSLNDYSLSQLNRETPGTIHPHVGMVGSPRVGR
jgi:hypothetical protein